MVVVDSADGLFLIGNSFGMPSILSHSMLATVLSHSMLANANDDGRFLIRHSFRLPTVLSHSVLANANDDGHFLIQHSFGLPTVLSHSVLANANANSDGLFLIDDAGHCRCLALAFS